MDQRLAIDAGGEIFLQALGKMEGCFLRYVLDAVQKLGRARPSDLDPPEQIGLGARHLEQALRIELRLAKNLRVGLEAHLGAAAVRDFAELLQPRFRLAARIDLPIELAAARDLDLAAL